MYIQQTEDTTFNTITAAGFKLVGGNVFKRSLGKLGLVAVVNRGLVNKGAQSYMEEKVSVYTVDNETKKRVPAGTFTLEAFAKTHTMAA